MKQRLPTELQKHLKKKLFNLLSYYQPEWGKQIPCHEPALSLKEILILHYS